MILEGIITTQNAAGELNIAPMGPIVREGESPNFTALHLRPFQTSRTYANLSETRCGVFHVTDDVLLVAQAAIHQLDELPPTQPASEIEGRIISDACRAFEFVIDEIDDSEDRTSMQARIVLTHELRLHFGFNRAKHAVLELAILATRLHLLPMDEVQRQLDQLRVPVEKTAGRAEREAFALVERHIKEHHTIG